MRRTSLTIAILTVLAVPAGADPVGDWRVEDGRAHIRTVLCAERLWGVVAWEDQPGTDAKNPDPSLRSRPTLGLPIIIGMKPVKPNRWEGVIYNAENGKTYQAAITHKHADRLEIEGCIMGGWLCSSEDWTRVKPPPDSVGSVPVPDLCLGLGIGAGQAGQGGLGQAGQGGLGQARQGGLGQARQGGLGQARQGGLGQARQGGLGQARQGGVK